MKKSIVGAIVGGLLIFIWQTLSWTMLDLHRPVQNYSAKQDTIMNFLSAHLEQGGYLLPTVPKGATMDEGMKMGEKMLGKPWASVQYHKSYDLAANDMYMNMVRGLVANIAMVWLLCWILGKWARFSSGSVFIACIFISLIVFINQPYTTFIWYKIFDLRAHLLDAVASWGLCGVWLGWWLKRK